jgi:hypothetical protein
MSVEMLPDSQTHQAMDLKDTTPVVIYDPSQDLFLPFIHNPGDNSPPNLLDQRHNPFRVLSRPVECFLKVGAQSTLHQEGASRRERPFRISQHMQTCLNPLVHHPVKGLHPVVCLDGGVALLKCEGIWMTNGT